MEFTEYARLCDIISDLCNNIEELKIFNSWLREKKDYTLEELLKNIDEKSDDLLNDCIEEQLYIGNTLKNDTIRYI